MRPRSFTYGRTISRDYQSRKLEVTYDLDEGGTLEEAIDAAKAYVDAKLAELDASTKAVAPRFRG